MPKFLSGFIGGALTVALMSGGVAYANGDFATNALVAREFSRIKAAIEIHGEGRRPGRLSGFGGEGVQEGRVAR